MRDTSKLVNWRGGSSISRKTLSTRNWIDILDFFGIEIIEESNDRVGSEIRFYKESNGQIIPNMYTPGTGGITRGAV
jgi:hypothetical protein